MFWLRCASALLRIFRAGDCVSTVDASRAHVRDRRAGVGARRAVGLRMSIVNVSRRRRGWLATLNTVWRRGSAGTNHISTFGVWRTGTRRASLRVNRGGETRWQRPFPHLRRITAGAGRQFDNGDLS
jgi:hypothetical protein